MPNKDSHPRVLFADSLHTFRFYYGNALRTRGFTVQVAKDILDLWGELSQREFDVVVIDALLLDSDANLLQNIATNYPRVKVVLFTWVISPEIESWCRQGHIAEALQKGEVSPEELAWRLEGLQHSVAKTKTPAKARAAANRELVDLAAAQHKKPTLKRRPTA